MNGTTYRIAQLVLRTGTALYTALLFVGVSPLAAQQLPAIPNAVRQQLSPASAPAPPRPSPPLPAKPAAAPSKPKPAAAPGKSAAAPAKPAAGSAKPLISALKPVGRRDPFDPLVNKDKPGSGNPANLPPGKAGLIIATLNLDGIVRGPSGMIAVVSNPQQRVYFLHQGDQLYDGQVGNISMEAVAFHQNGRDPFGAVIARDVTRRLYPSPGEQP